MTPTTYHTRDLLVLLCVIWLLIWLLKTLVAVVVGVVVGGTIMQLWCMCGQRPPSEPSDNRNGEQRAHSMGHHHATATGSTSAAQWSRPGPILMWTQMDDHANKIASVNRYSP
jgi:hypothetical protein